MQSVREREESNMTPRFLTCKNRRKKLPLREVEKPVGGTGWRVYINNSLLFILNLRYQMEITKKRESGEKSKLRCKGKSHQYTDGI